MKKIFFLLTVFFLTTAFSGFKINKSVSIEKFELTSESSSKLSQSVVTLKVTCLTSRTLPPSDSLQGRVKLMNSSFEHKVKLMNGTSPVANAEVKINDPIGRLCTIVKTNSSGEATWIRPIPPNTKQQFYTIEFFYGNVKQYSTVAVTLPSGATKIPSYSISLNSAGSLDNSTLVMASRGGFTSTQQTINTTLKEATRFGIAVAKDYLSNPVNILTATVAAVSCTAGQSIPAAGQATCIATLAMVNSGLAKSTVKILGNKLIDASNFLEADKKNLKNMLELSTIAYSVAALNPAEGLSKIDAVGAGFDFVKNAYGQLIYVNGKLKGASFPAQKAGSSEVYMMCIYGDAPNKSEVQTILPPSKSEIQSSLPPEMNKIFFEGSKFSQPIWLELPSESSLSYFQQISQTPDIYESGIPSTTIEYKSRNSLEEYDKNILNFLVKNGYARIETRVQTRHNSYVTDSKTYHFLFYSDDFKKNIQNFSMTENFQQKMVPFIKLAHRNLISIDYKNEYEDAPLGMKRTFYSAVFSYSFVNDLPNLQAINKVFKGKGKVFKDPDDGTWKMVGPFENLGLILGDNNSGEFSSFFRNNYEPYRFEDKATPSTNANTNTIDNNVKRDDNNIKREAITNSSNELNKILLSKVTGSLTENYLSGNLDLFIDQKAGTKEKSNVLFLFNYKDGINDNIKPDVKNNIINQFQNWIENSIDVTRVNLNSLKEDSLFKVELIFTARLVKITELDAYIKTRIYITKNGKLVADESFERSKSLLASKEPNAVLESAISNCQKKIAKVLGEYLSIE